MFAAYGHLVYRFRWPIVAAWVLILAASVVFVSAFSTPLAGGGFTTSGMESEQAVAALTRELKTSPATVSVIFTDDKLTVDDAAYRQAVEGTLTRLKGVTGVGEVSSFYTTGAAHTVSQDRHTTYATVAIEGSSGGEAAFLEKLRGQLQAGPPRAILSGELVVYSDMEDVAHRDLVRAETIALPVSLIVLLFIFGSVVAAGLPVTLGGLAVVSTLAGLYALARFTDVSIFSLNIASMLGLGISIDYTLLLVSRFREEMEKSGDIQRSLVTTVSTAGKTVFFSGTIVFIGLSGLLVFPFMIFRSLAYGGMIVVVVALVAALTLVPAALGILGPRLNALSVRRIRHQDGGFWLRLAKQVMKHPVAIFSVALVVIAILSYPALRMRFGLPDASSLPGSTASREGSDLIAAKFGPGEDSPILVVLQSSNNVMSSENVGAAYDLTEKLSADPRVQRVEGLFNVDPSVTKNQYQMLYGNPSMIPSPQLREALGKLSSKNLTFLSVVSKSGSMEDASKQLVKDIRGMTVGGDLQKQVGGVTASAIDIDDRLFADFPIAIGAVVVVTFLVLLVLLRSIVLPAKAAVMSCLSILAASGVLVLVFQDGHLSGSLGFTPQGFVDSITPVMLFCILFGLSMDYEVFLLTRIQEAFERTGDNRASITEGLQRTGRIITSAAAVMIIVTGSFALTDLLTVKSIGLGSAVAILLDATIVRALLVPSAMRLLGNLNWWAPSFIRRKAPKLAVD